MCRPGLTVSGKNIKNFHDRLEKGGKAMATRPSVGDKARRFSLSDQNGREFKITDFKGKRVLLSFHPQAWTSVCAEQMKSLEKTQGTFDKLKTIAVGVSVDTVPSKKAWAASLGIKTTRLLSDF